MGQNIEKPQQNEVPRQNETGEQKKTTLKVKTLKVKSNVKAGLMCCKAIRFD